MTEERETASQKYRRKLKKNTELYAEHLGRERARDALRREAAKKKMEKDENLKKIARTKSRERMRESRRRRRERQIQTAGSGHGNPSEFEKTVAKVKRSLPASPDRAAEVIKKIAVEFNISISNKKGFSDRMPLKIRNKLKRKISDFYHRDDISRQIPGMKDMKPVNLIAGTKIIIQKRMMIVSIREAFELFKIAYPKTLVDEILFYEERPFYILPVNNTRVYSQTTLNL